MRKIFSFVKKKEESTDLIIASYKNDKEQYVQWRVYNNINFIDGVLGKGNNSTLISYVSDEIVEDWLEVNKFVKLTKKVVDDDE